MSIWLKAFSGLFLNLSAGWFGAVFILPGLTGNFLLVSLTANLLCGMLSLFLHVILERRLNDASK